MQEKQCRKLEAGKCLLHRSRLVCTFHSNVQLKPIMTAHSAPDEVLEQRFGGLL